MAKKPHRVREEQRVMVDSRDYNEAEIRKMIPRKLYKYSSINNYFLQGLESHSLWFSCPLDFNDPFDCRVTLNYGRSKKDIIANFAKVFPAERAKPDLDLNELLETFLKKPAAFEGILNDITHYTFSNILGVCCFSANNDHILMWSHYAANHSGVCLQFNSARHGLIHNNVLPVQYFAGYPKINLSDYKKEEIRSFYYQAICAKADQWDYEFEWRAILSEGGRKSYPYEKADLTGIIFGVNTSGDDLKKITDVVQNAGLSHVQYYKAEMSAKEYKLIVKKM